MAGAFVEVVDGLTQEEEKEVEKILRDSLAESIFEEHGVKFIKTPGVAEGTTDIYANVIIKCPHCGKEVWL